MQTLVIASQKGGSGKTMLAAHLSVEAARDGVAWVIDTDHQATLTFWHERRQAETPQRLEVPIEKIKTGLARVAESGAAAFCFIDTAPTVSEQNTALLGIADFVIIPVRPSPSDLWAVGETVALVKAAHKPFLFVVTQAKPQATITAQAVAALSQHGRVAQAFITDRVAYAAAMTGGSTAPELAPRPKGAQLTGARKEIADLWNEIKSCFP